MQVLARFRQTEWLSQLHLFYNLRNSFHVDIALTGGKNCFAPSPDTVCGTDMASASSHFRRDAPSLFVFIR